MSTFPTPNIDTIRDALLDAWKMYYTPTRILVSENTWDAIANEDSNFVRNETVYGIPVVVDAGARDGHVYLIDDAKAQTGTKEAKP